MKQKKETKGTHWSKFFTVTIILVVLAATTIALIPLAHLLTTEAGQQVIVDKMQSFGIFAPLLFVLLQVLQVVIAFIPGGPVPIIGGILFGEWGALALCLAGFFLGTVLVYYLVQWIGHPLVDRFVSENHFQKFDFLRKGKRLELFIFLVFLLPGLPKDVLTYLVSFDSKIKPMHLFFLTTLARTPATILTVFVGRSLWNGNYTLTIVLIGIMAALAVGGLFIKKKIDKRAQRKQREKKKTTNVANDSTEI